MSALKTFSAEPLEWRPYLTPVDLSQATPEQLDAMKVTPSNRKISEYVLTLAHDPESLAVRSPLFNAIMYGAQGLERSERELGAVACSVVNECGYCVAAHASRYIRLSGRNDVIEEIFSNRDGAQLDDHSQAIFDFSVKLSKTPLEASAEDIRSLRDIGMDDLQIVDLVLATSIFGWANRLMHTLGEPVTPKTSG